MEEIFKVYKETNSRYGHRIYEVSNFGRVKVNGEIVEPTIELNGYLRIRNPGNKPQVDHIDNDKHNNCVDNLRWVTRVENMNNPITKKTLQRVHKGKKLSDLHKQHISESCTGNHWTVSDIGKEHISQSLIGNQNAKGHNLTDKSKHEVGKATRGKVLMNNGKEQMFVIPPWDQDMLIFGWEYGKLKKG